MVATDEEIEATRKLSMEIDAKVAELIKQGRDPSKSLAPLHDMADKEFGRLGEVMAAPKPPEGTALAIFEATIGVISDWSEFEVTALLAMEEASGGGKAATPRPARPTQRRGMRI
jgi:hypothetical protein